MNNFHFQLAVLHASDKKKKLGYLQI